MVMRDRSLVIASGMQRLADEKSVVLIHILSLASVRIRNLLYLIFHTICSFWYKSRFAPVRPFAIFALVPRYCSDYHDYPLYYGDILIS
jgi:hypothetical protein